MAYRDVSRSLVNGGVLLRAFTSFRLERRITRVRNNVPVCAVSMASYRFEGQFCRHVNAHRGGDIFVSSYNHDIITTQTLTQTIQTES